MSVSWAVKDTVIAKRWLEDQGFSVWEAPQLRTSSSRAPTNFADMLLNEGHGNAESLSQAIDCWLALFENAQPDALVYNHAPTALLAARIAGLPVLIYGTGFEIPPLARPLPGFRPWMQVAPALAAEKEHIWLDSVNALLTRQGAAPLASLSDLFPQAAQQLTTFPELDPFGPRPYGTYLGPIYATATAEAATWTGSCKRIIAYLRPSVPGVATLLTALNELEADVLCTVPGMPPTWPNRFPKLRLFSQLLDLTQLLPAADLMITYGASTIGSALLAGVPVLAVPQVIEQYLTGLRLEQLGAGRVLRERRTRQICTAMLDDMLSNPRYRQMAGKFAQCHAGYQASVSVNGLKQSLESLL